MEKKITNINDKRMTKGKYWLVQQEEKKQNHHRRKIKLRTESGCSYNIKLKAFFFFFFINTKKFATKST